MNEIQTFTNNLFGSVRVIPNQNGEPLFCLADVAKALDLTNQAHIKESLDERMNVINNDPYIRTTYIGYLPYVYIPTSVQTGIKKDGTPAIQSVNMIYLNEDSLYFAILQSRKPEAVIFQLWVASIIKLIRKVGIEKSEQLLKSELEKLQQQNQYLTNHVQELEEVNNGLAGNNFLSGVRAADQGEMRAQMIEKIRSIPDNVLSPELKQFIIQYDENWGN